MKTREPSVIDKFTELRARAEQQLAKEEAGAVTMSPEELLQTVHELHTHQIELELQNEDLRLATTELEKSRKKFSDLYDFAPVGYLTVSDKGLIIESNLTAAEMLRTERSKLLKQPLSVFILHEDQDRYYRCRHKLLQTNKTQLCEVRMYSKDGQLFTAQLKCSVHPQLDRDAGQYRAILTDISERKKLDDQLRQKHKMEAVGYMAGGMAHNFNNNLGIILGNIELAQLKQPDNSEVIPFLENAKISVRRSHDLVQKIITYGRQGIIHKAPMHLTTIIDETLSLLQSTLPTTIKLQHNYCSGCHARLINADPSQIQEVLINLCNNAVQAMNETGNLTISLEPVELKQQDILAQYDCLPGPYSKLSVQDTGYGIPPDMLDKIFDPFYSTKEEYEGAGMGLATVQGIVAQHGGMIKVDSVPHQGTTFEIYFPLLIDTNLEEAPVEERRAFQRGTEHILFVDDDERLATLGEQLLSTLGYQISMMTDSAEALKMFTANADRFDLVITDQTMPNLTGKDLIAEIKKIRADIPTILCTGYSSKIDEDEAAKLGISAFMMKPLDLLQLSETVRQVLDGDKEI